MCFPDKNNEYSKYPLELNYILISNAKIPNEEWGAQKVL